VPRMYHDPNESKKNQPVEVKKKAQDGDKDKKTTSVAIPDYSHDVNCFLVKREKGQPGPGNYDTLKKMGNPKYHDDGKNKNAAKPKTEDKDKDKKKKKEDNFPGPGSYNPFSFENKNKGEDKTADKGKKDDKKNDKALEYAT